MVNRDDPADPRPPAAEESDPNAYAEHAGTVLRLVFGYPPTAIRSLYQDITPRLFVDGEEQPVDGWTEFVMPLPSGTHRVQVYVPFETSRFGEVDQEVSVTGDQEVLLEYLAPTIPAAAGRLRTPQEVAADDARDTTFALRAFMVLAVLVLVAAFAIWG